MNSKAMSPSHPPLATLWQARRGLWRGLAAQVAEFIKKPLRAMALWLKRLDTSIVMLAFLLILALLMVLALTVGPPVYRRH